MGLVYAELFLTNAEDIGLLRSEIGVTIFSGCPRMQDRENSDIDL